MMGREATGTAGDPTAGNGRRGRRLLRTIRLIYFGIFLTMVAFVGGFLAFANHVSGMSTPGNPEKAEGIIVLTGGQARISAAVALLRAGKGDRLLISGVHPSADSDDLAVATGSDPALFACCVDIDYAALDTVGNAEESAKWVTSRGYRSIILVTNNYHMPRSLLELGRLLNGVRLDPYPVVNTDLRSFAWLSQPNALRVLLTEYLKYIAALGGFSPRINAAAVEASAVR